jgi:hypothetical protein
MPTNETKLTIKQCHAGQLVVGNVLVTGNDYNISLQKITKIDTNSGSIMTIYTTDDLYYIQKQEDCWIVNI